ncbi:MAG TPA: isoprenylcysteine carboxylmethyltransferase family protein [Anaerolineaceae bacterium]|nr:isoprenylcysteine carboxylmethyltransferase family protein [Anaerolineaceae bacterium]
MTIVWIERIVRWLGGLLAYGTFAVILVGIWRGTHHQVGHSFGRAPSWLHSIWFYLITSMVFLGLCIIGWKPFPLKLSGIFLGATLVIGALLYFPGLLLVLWGRLSLGRNYFTSTASGVQLFADHQLATNGPFAYLRHPMYLGLILAGFGSLLIFKTWTSLFFALFSPLVAFRAKREEQALAAEFGEQYLDYCSQVPGWFPRLRKLRR